jgi:aryl-alcohol dehydrogenase-like predicted oxidoreductase
VQGENSSGVNAKRVGFGCAGLHGAVSAHEAEMLLETALDNGVTHFDTARVYGWGAAEAMLGALARRRRDEMVFVS